MKAARIYYFWEQMSKRAQIEDGFRKYIPQEFVPYVVDLLFSAKVQFKVSRSRKTKLGDYRPPHGDRTAHVITVNHDLNPYAFLITTLHEFAHMNTYLKFGNKVKAHGFEWKAEFRTLLIPLLDSSSIPDDIKKALAKSIFNLKASSCTDANLFRTLKQYNKNAATTVLVEEIAIEQRFVLQDKLFERGFKRRSRYLCKDVSTGRMYLINGLAEVEPVKQKE